ncbi:MAG: hypothetical protein A3H34_06875 [Betaproteobacteria bacterium RIFCSPLOWO2_02_FULL_67_19]|nr:MAG: hypothetical protein A3H34_06875 [Betaproteobacteria bacterium RIFCSPLOWO2_02_FULL_67_19]
MLDYPVVSGQFSVAESRQGLLDWRLADRELAHCISLVEAQLLVYQPIARCRATSACASDVLSFP